MAFVQVEFKIGRDNRVVGEIRFDEQRRSKIVFPGKSANMEAAAGQTWICEVIRDTQPENPRKGALIVKPVRQAKETAEFEFISPLSVKRTKFYGVEKGDSFLWTCTSEEKIPQECPADIRKKIETNLQELRKTAEDRVRFSKMLCSGGKFFVKTTFKLAAEKHMLDLVEERLLPFHDIRTNEQLSQALEVLGAPVSSKGNFISFQMAPENPFSVSKNVLLDNSTKISLADDETSAIVEFKGITVTLENFFRVSNDTCHFWGNLDILLETKPEAVKGGICSDSEKYLSEDEKNLLRSKIQRMSNDDVAAEYLQWFDKCKGIEYFQAFRAFLNRLETEKIETKSMRFTEHHSEGESPDGMRAAYNWTETVYRDVYCFSDMKPVDINFGFNYPRLIETGKELSSIIDELKNKFQCEFEKAAENLKMIAAEGQLQALSTCKVG